ncbi:hypothetical protein LR48_Vigan06g068200 [Vigna angularis]|uniref:Uncharacterized protein n=1 Tax=Phaseolus angularis TaxID=3914 RepID=A0A0L9URN3_PHAAN|nr:hypothetical protein LR48_Vigan06g068200 [Vigna angularis]
MFNDVDSVSQFRRGLEEATKLLPSGPKLVIGLHSNGEEQKNNFGNRGGVVKGEERDGGKDRSKKKGRKKETVDLRNHLLMYANDIRVATELLTQIRQHSSPFGDASQKRITAVEYLKAYQVFLSSTPFKKFTYFFANTMIMEAAAKSETVHIIDFGILYGFQWPILIKFLSNIEGGPPKLRITGIKFLQLGFHPSERIEETGHRLANYCKRYNVPFEYHVVVSRNPRPELLPIRF